MFLSKNKDKKSRKKATYKVYYDADRTELLRYGRHGANCIEEDVHIIHGTMVPLRYYYGVSKVNILLRDIDTNIQYTISWKDFWDHMVSKGTLQLEEYWITVKKGSSYFIRPADKWERATYPTLGVASTENA